MISPAKFSIIAASFAAISLLGACALNEPLSATQSNAAAGASSEAFRPVSDVPIPKDAALDAEKSLILSGQNEWTGRLVMVTSVNATETYAFYKTQMPLFDWTPIMSVQSGISVLTFSRAGTGGHHPDRAPRFRWFRDYRDRSASAGYGSVRASKPDGK